MEWKEIKGFENIYKISNTGKLKSVDRKIINSLGRCSLVKGKEKVLRPSNDGYYRATLYNTKRQCIGKYIHRLVAETFIPNPNNLPQINHIDGDKSNNNFTNLEWSTSKDNIRHSHNTGLITSERCHLAKLSKKEVIKILNRFYAGDSFKEVCSKYPHISKSNLTKIKYGYTWKRVLHPWRSKQKIKI